MILLFSIVLSIGINTSLAKIVDSPPLSKDLREMLEKTVQPTFPWRERKPFLPPVKP